MQKLQRKPADCEPEKSSDQKLLGQEQRERKRCPAQKRNRRHRQHITHRVIRTRLHLKERVRMILQSQLLRTENVEN